MIKKIGVSRHHDGFKSDDLPSPNRRNPNKQGIHNKQKEQASPTYCCTLGERVPSDGGKKKSDAKIKKIGDAGI